MSVRMDPRLAARFDPSDVVQEALLTASIQLPRHAQARGLPFYPWLRQLAWQRLVHLHNHHFTAQRRSVVREVGMQLSNDSVLKLAEPFMSREASPSHTVEREELLLSIQNACLAVYPTMTVKF